MSFTEGKFLNIVESANGEYQLRRPPRCPPHLAPPRSWLSKSVRCGGRAERAEGRYASRLLMPALVRAEPVPVHPHDTVGGDHHPRLRLTAPAPARPACLLEAGRETNPWGSATRR